MDAYVEQVGEDVLKAAILRDAVLDYLVDNCVQVEIQTVMPTVIQITRKTAVNKICAGCR